MNYKMIDLCAGIGGIRRGFELAGGFKNVLSGEIDKYACMTYEHLFGEDPSNDITSEEFLNKVKNIEYDILLAGFPCQSFSRAGKQEGFLDETRGTIFFSIARLIKESRPKAFMLENVDNLISHEKGRTFDTIIRILVEELNYKVVGVEKIDGKLVYNRKDFVRNSKDFGVPQNRPRVFIMGFSKDFYGDNCDAKVPNVLPKKRETKLYKNLRCVIDNQVDPKYYISSGYVATLEKHRDRHKTKGNGFGYKIINLPDIEEPISNALLATGGSGKERNLVIDFEKNYAGLQLKTKQTPINSDGIRTMTPIEWGRLQGFINYGFIDKETGIDNFSFPEKIADGQRYKQFGNAVTIPVIEEMAKFMKKILRELCDQVER